MLQGWVVVIIALAYIGFLFLVASYGDRRRELSRGSASRLLIYPLSLAIYCTSWTFFGSVGLASRGGLDFFAIYIGPMVMVGLAYPLLIRIVRLAKGQNITSIADLIAARYGKSQAVAATVALIAIVGMVPYIALQLKAVSSSVGTILAQAYPGGAQPIVGDSALFVALLMAAFAVLFGTRHTDATEHQDGLMLAIATESIVKLVAFLAVGIFVTFVMFHGPLALFTRALDQANTAAVLTRVPPLTSFCAMTVLSLFAIVLLPRQFHVAVVENHSEAEIRRAAWLFPVYLVLINLFVLPIAMAGLLTFPLGRVDSDMFVLALPIAAHSELITLIAFVGGLSAATAMVIVESVALAIMVSNDIVVPMVLKRRATLAGSSDAGAWLLMTRRIAIFVILLLAYIYYRSAGEAQLAAIGLLSFAAVAQLAPAFFGGLIWPRGTARGAIAGMTAGILVWGYTLLVPSISDAGIVSANILTDGPWDLGYLRPQALFGLDLPPLVHGVLLSLAANIACYVGWSLSRRPTPIERVQADVFVPSTLAPILAPMAPSFRLRRASVTVEELIATVARYLGEERTRKSSPVSPPRAASVSNRKSKPILRCCNTANICWRRPSARPRRGWCCRCCCASARSRPRTRSSCSTTPMRRSTTIARSCRPRSITCAKASPCSTRISIWCVGTASSAKYSICRTASPASASRSTRFCAMSPSMATTTKRISMRPSPSASPNIRPRSSRSSNALPSAGW